jgi:hypothetical protein
MQEQYMIVGVACRIGIVFLVVGFSPRKASKLLVNADLRKNSC